MKKTGILLGILLISISFANAINFRVTINGDDSRNGLNWSTAFATVQKAIDEARPNIDEIWVQEGIYYSAPIQMRNGVAIYGGFKGNEGSRDQRNWSTNITTLYGHQGHHVIRNIGPLDNSAILDGFHIMDGRAVLGGGIYNQNASPTIRNCEIYGNYANEGAGIYNLNSSPRLVNVKIYNNQASITGGGVTNRGNSGIFIENSSIYNNTSAGNGGGIAHYSTSAATLSFVSISENRSNSSGGGIYNSGSADLLVQNCTITENTGVDGAGIANSVSGAMKVEHTTISNNTADNYGGGVFNQGNHLSIFNSNMTGNNAFSGGGICNEAASPKILSVTFTGNVARGFGGGMTNIYDCRPVMEDLFFINNQAKSGGGMENIYVVDLKLSRITFDGNKASSMGGGICNEKSGNITVDNTVITGNRSPAVGGGMCNIDLKSLILTNVTISGNIANSGGGMFNELIPFNSFLIHNTIIWGNQDLSGNNNIHNNYNCTPIYRYSLVEGTGGSGAGPWGSYGVDGGNNIDVNPLFAGFMPGTSGGNYRLQNGSLAIGTGSIALAALPITVDRAGNPRIMGNIDMGAYESGYKSLVTTHTQESEAPAILSEISQISVSVYPNPVISENTLFIEIDTDENYTGVTEIEVFNSLGAKVSRFQTTERNTTITMPREKGIYFVRFVLNNGGSKTEKVTVW